MGGKPDESALRRREDELETLRTYTSMYVHLFDDPKKWDTEMARKDDDLKSMALYTKILNGLSDERGEIERKEDELTTLRLYSSMMLGLSDVENQRTEIKRKIDDLISM